ncbi:MAG: DeoR/GlpR transcriptional regulator [Spirochaetales bacterium]|nr:MAG: DeoR/GlpR transcriptional regulator [Spirochaetales bacterium]
MKQEVSRFIEERHEQILDLIDTKGRVTVKELKDKFGMSLVTLRSDLKELEFQGKIRRTHGGAMAVEDKPFAPPFSIRKSINQSQKQAIGKAAAELVNNREVIFIDGGTTAAEMRLFLSDKQNITVISPSIEVAYWLCVTTSVTIYMLNGFLLRESLGVIGEPAMETIDHWNISKAFCGAAGLTEDAGLTDNHVGFIEQKRIITKKAHKVVGLVDSSKWGVVSLGTFANISEIDTIITDRSAPRDMINCLKKHDIEVILA